MAKGAAVALRWVHELQPISNELVYLQGLNTVRHGIDPGNLRILSQVVGVLEIWKKF